MPVPELSEMRPWGSFDVLEVQDTHRVKRMRIQPGHRLSLQFHHHRDEHWVVVSGRGLVTLGDREIEIAVGSYVHIPALTHHRIKCVSDEPLVCIEVWTGSVLDENDNVRLQDDYRRLET